MLNAAALSTAESTTSDNFVSAPVSPSINPTTYLHNLNALRAFQPAIAEIIDQTPVPAAVRWVRARDGRTTFHLQDPTGRMIWFGGSSMPSISAEETFSTAVDSGGNVALPGILTGLEPLVLAHRLPECRAIFVVESNPLFLKLAMQLHDYVALFSRGRLVFFIDNDLAGRVVEFFHAYPGFLLPTQIFRVPQRNPAEIFELQGRLEAIGEKVARFQAEALDAAVGRISRRSSSAIPEKPRVAILGTDASQASFEFANRIARGLKKLGWVHSMCVPESPGKCHIVARVGAVSQIDADVAFWINSRSGPLLSLLPSTPMVSWCSPDAPGASVGGEAGNNELLVVSEIRAKALDTGSAKSCIEVVAPAADDHVFHPLSDDERDATLETEVAIIANLPVDDPLRCGVSLPSLVSVWHAAQQIIQRTPDAYDASLAASIVKQAEQECGIALQDSRIRERLERNVRDRVAPAAIARIDAETLVKAGVHVSIWGDNWRGVSQNSSALCGPIPSPSKLNHVFNASHVVLIPTCGDADLQTALDAMCAGACVILGDATSIGVSRTLLDPALDRHFHKYRSRSELVAKARRILSDRDYRMASSMEARKIVLSRHTVSHRIIQVVDRLRIR